MSEPLGCSGQLSSAYCPESTLPLLETVSEEARRQTGKKNIDLIWLINIEKKRKKLNSLKICMKNLPGILMGYTRFVL